MIFPLSMNQSAMYNSKSKLFVAYTNSTRGGDSWSSLDKKKYIKMIQILSSIPKFIKIAYNHENQNNAIVNIKNESFDI